MLVPVELLTKGMQYIPFFAFQLAVTVYLASLFVHVDEIEDENQFSHCPFSWVISSRQLFSNPMLVVRHESATFPVLHLLVMSSNQCVSAWKANAAALNPSSISNPNTHRHGKVSRDEAVYRVFSGDITRSGARKRFHYGGK